MLQPLNVFIPRPHLKSPDPLKEKRADCRSFRLKDVKYWSVVRYHLQAPHLRQLGLRRVGLFIFQQEKKTWPAATPEKHMTGGWTGRGETLTPLQPLPLFPNRSMQTRALCADQPSHLPAQRWGGGWRRSVGHGRSLFPPSTASSGRGSGNKTRSRCDSRRGGKRGLKVQPASNGSFWDPAGQLSVLPPPFASPKGLGSPYPSLRRAL